MLTAILIGLLFILLGVAFTLFGYRLFVFLLPIWGFIAGFLLGAQVISSIFGNGLLSTAFGWIFGFGIGILVAILSYFIYSFGVYMLAATFGLGIGAVVMHAIGIDSGLVITAVALAAAIVMIALVGYLDLKKWLIVFVTAFGGSLAIFSGILIALETVSLSEIQSGINPVSAVVNESLIWIILWGAVGILGIVFQARTTKDFFQGEDYEYYRQIVKREQDVLGTTTVEEKAEQVIAPSGHTDEDDEQSDIPDELAESSPKKKMNDQETINEELSKDVEPDSEAPQDDPIDESETEGS